MTIPKALEHSLPQLKMLANAVVRVRSHGAILDLRIAIAGTAGGNGNKGAKKLIDEFQRDMKRNAKTK